MNVIIVDDEKLAVENLEGKLRKISRIGEVHGFTDTDEALEYVKQTAVDVAFLDINMQQMLGLILAAKIRELRPCCAVIFVTGYSQYAVDAFQMHVEGYLLKPVRVEDIERELDHLRRGFARRRTDKLVRIQCFGNFEAFANDMPLVFRYAKTKELLAYLVDRKGSAISSGELMAVLWEDKHDTISLRNQLRNLISDLTRTLREAGAEDVLIKANRCVAVDSGKLDCDYYSFVNNEPWAVNKYSGEYMSQYSWGEMTIGALDKQQ